MVGRRVVSILRPEKTTDNCTLFTRQGWKNSNPKLKKRGDSYLKPEKRGLEDCKKGKYT